MSRAFAFSALAGVLVLAMFVPRDAVSQEAAYVGLRRCGFCHSKELYGDQVTAWRNGKHARALETLASERALEYAKKLGIDRPPAEADECLRCHVTAYGVDARLIKFPLDPADGVQCESCHGPGSRYWRKSVMADHAKAVANGMACPLDRHLPQSELCWGCHNRESPTWDPERYVLPDGSRTGFDYEQAARKVRHSIPEDRRGRIVELEKALREEKKRRAAE